MVTMLLAAVLVAAPASGARPAMLGLEAQGMQSMETGRFASSLRASLSRTLKTWSKFHFYNGHRCGSGYQYCPTDNKDH